MMKFKLLIIALLLQSLFSCKTANVRVAYNEKVDFFQFKTYNWMPEKKDSKTSFISLDEQKVREKVETLLSEKHLAKSEKPDVLITVNLTEKDKVEYHPRFGMGYYPYRYHGFSRYDAHEYTEYTIFIAMVDPETKKALWEGSVKDWNYSGITESNLNELLAGILEKYPPIADGAYSEVPLN